MSAPKLIYKTPEKQTPLRFGDPGTYSTALEVFENDLSEVRHIMGQNRIDLMRRPKAPKEPSYSELCEWRGTDWMLNLKRYKSYLSRRSPAELEDLLAGKFRNIRKSLAGAYQDSSLQIFESHLTEAVSILEEFLSR